MKKYTKKLPEKPKDKVCGDCEYLKACQEGPKPPTENSEACEEFSDKAKAVFQELQREVSILNKEIDDVEYTIQRMNHRIDNLGIILNNLCELYQLSD